MVLQAPRGAREAKPAEAPVPPHGRTTPTEALVSPVVRPHTEAMRVRVGGLRKGGGLRR